MVVVLKDITLRAEILIVPNYSEIAMNASAFFPAATLARKRERDGERE